MKVSMGLLVFGLIATQAYAQEKLQLREGERTPLVGMNAGMTKQECTTVNLTEGVGPVRTQLLNTCYAHSAADLISFGQNQQYSAMYMAFSSEIDTPPISNDPLSAIHGFNGGLVSHSLGLALKYGGCPEKVIASDYYALSELYQQVLKAYDEAVEAGVKDLENISELENTYGLPLDVKTKLAAWYAFKEAAEFSFPHVNFATLEEIFKKSPREWLVNDIALESCQLKLVQFKNKSVNETDILIYENDKWYFTKEGQKKLLSHVNKTLNEGRPVSITFETTGMTSFTAGSLGVHSATVAGRFWKDNRCHFIVKNSYGKSWKAPEGLKAMNVAHLPGYFAISEQSLLEHVHAATSLDDRPLTKMNVHAKKLLPPAISKRRF